jgi:hypothetical protein
MKYAAAIYSARLDTSYLVACEGYSKREALRVVVMQELVDIQARRRCKAEGHRYVDESYGGPNSGGIDVHCTRCGHSISHPFY